MVHKKDDIIRRIVPKNNPDINEAWIADRDRFGFDGIYSEDRISNALIKSDKDFDESKLSNAIDQVVERIRSCKNENRSIAVLFSPSSSTEEQYLLSDLCHQLGITAIDSRLRQGEFINDVDRHFTPHMNITLSEVDTMKNILVIGSDLRKETPILAHRV